MKTARCSTYHSPGRVCIASAPANVRRGYRVHRTLFIRHPLTPGELRQRLADLDARATVVEMHRLTWPAEPIIMGDAPAGVPSYRIVIAQWLAFAAGEPIPELDPTSHRPRRFNPTRIPGLVSVLSESIFT